VSDAALLNRKMDSRPSSLRKAISKEQNVDGPHVWDKPDLSGYLICLVHLVSLIQPNKPDRPNRPNEQDRLADFFNILLACIIEERDSCDV
jgi:hypothetical protein